MPLFTLQDLRGLNGCIAGGHRKPIQQKRFRFASEPFLNMIIA